MALDYYETGGPNGEATCGSLPYMIPTTTGAVYRGREGPGTYAILAWKQYVKFLASF